MSIIPQILDNFLIILWKSIDFCSLMPYNKNITQRKGQEYVNQQAIRNKTTELGKRGHGGYDVPPVDTF